MKVKDLRESLTTVNPDLDITTIRIKGLPQEKPKEYKINSIQILDVIKITSLKSDDPTDGVVQIVELECETTHENTVN